MKSRLSRATSKFGYGQIFKHGWALVFLSGCGIVFNNPRPLYHQIELYTGRYQPNGVIDGNLSQALLPSYSRGMVSIGSVLYFLDFGSVRAIDFSNPSQPIVKTIAGESPTQGATDSPSGSGSTARFRSPFSLTTDGTYLYVADTNNHCIRTVDPSSGAVSTLAGLCGTFGNSNGTGTSATFNSPQGITYQSPFLYVADTGNHLVRRVTLSGVVTTIAGTAGSFGYANNVTGTSALFLSPTAITSDANALYISEQIVNSTIRKIDLVGGTYTVSTLAGVAPPISGVPGTSGQLDSSSGTSATFNSPVSFSSDSQYIYAVDFEPYYTIRKIDKTTGATTTLAGTFGITGETEGLSGIGKLGGQTRSTALLNGDLYAISDGILRKINVSTGLISAVSGNQSLVSPVRDTHVRLTRVSGLFPDGNSLYLFFERANTIRKMDLTTSLISPYAGSHRMAGVTDGNLSQALFSKPWSMTRSGNDFYVADTGNHVIRKIDSSGNVTTIAGLAGTSGYTNGTGSAARFYYPTDLIGVGSYLYIVDSYNKAIRQMNLSNYAVVTFAGADAPTALIGSADANGTSARFNVPIGITAVGTDLYVADTSNHRIRKITVAADVTTLAGSTSGYAEGIGTAAKFTFPTSLTSDGTDLYVLDRSNSVIRKINLTTSTTSLYAGSPGSPGNQDGIGTQARFYIISNGSYFFNGAGIRYSSGKLYVAEPANEVVKTVDLQTGAAYVIAGGGYQAESGNALPTRPRFGSLVQVGKDLYSGYDRVIWKINSSGGAELFAGSLSEGGNTDGSRTSARFSGISHLTTDGKDIFVFQGTMNVIRKITLSSGTVTTFAGSSTNSGSIDASVGTQATFSGPYGGCADSEYLYVMDYNNHVVRAVNLASSAVSTLSGSAGTSGSADGSGLQARFKYPLNCVKAGTALYINDSGNLTIRKMELSSFTSPIISTFAGQAGVTVTGYTTDGFGTNATFQNVVDMTSDGIYLYVTDSSRLERVIRRIRFSTAEVSLFAGVRGLMGSTQNRLRLDPLASFYAPSKLLWTSQGIFVIDGNEGILLIH